MKKRIFSIVAIAALIALPMSVAAQNTSTVSSVSSSAKIITPISVSLTSGTLDFGSIATTTGGGNVTRTALGRTSTGTNDLVPQFAGGVPIFSVSGQATYLYTITLPNDDVISLSGPSGATPMKIKGFTPALQDATGVLGTLDATGAQKFNVGATLEVNGNQMAGVYTGEFDVTVTYN